MPDVVFVKINKTEYRILRVKLHDGSVTILQFFTFDFDLQEEGWTVESADATPLPRDFVQGFLANAQASKLGIYDGGKSLDVGDTLDTHDEHFHREISL